MTNAAGETKVDYRIKGEQRAKRLAKAKTGMQVSNRSIFTIQRVIGDKAKAAKVAK